MAAIAVLIFLVLEVVVPEQQVNLLQPKRVVMEEMV
jgi:hypothetical protein